MAVLEIEGPQSAAKKPTYLAIIITLAISLALAALSVAASPDFILRESR